MINLCLTGSSQSCEVQSRASFPISQNECLAPLSAFPFTSPSNKRLGLKIQNGQVAPGGYPPGLPQTRTCIFDAYGSSDHGLASATRCCFVDTVVEFRCIRRLSHQRFHNPTPRFPPRGPGGPVPAFHRYYQGATTCCRPLRRASFPSLGATTRCTQSRGDVSISQVPGKPRLCLCPVLRLRCDGSLLTLAVRTAWPP